MIIAPSILSADPGKYAREIVNIAEQGADWIHIDVMDGSFVPPITFGDNIVQVARQNCELELDTHLMIRNPERHLETFAAAKSDRLTVHIEACDNPADTLQKIRALNMKPGLAISPGTAAQDCFDLIPLCNLLLVMTVNPGYGGQAFIMDCLRKVESVRNCANSENPELLIEVDGGINPDTARLCADAGADVLVAGSAIFNTPNRNEAIQALRAAGE